MRDIKGKGADLVNMVEKTRRKPLKRPVNVKREFLIKAFYKNQRELAKVFNVRESTMSSYIDSLLRERLVEIAPYGRKIPLVTEKGEKLYQNWKIYSKMVRNMCRY